MVRFMVATLLLASAAPVAADEIRRRPSGQDYRPLSRRPHAFCRPHRCDALAGEVIGGGPGPLFRRHSDDFAFLQKRWEVLIPAFRKAGGTDLYIVFSLIDLTNGPFFVVPMRGEDKPLPAYLTGLMEGSNRMAEKIGSAVVVAPKTTLERLRELKPVAQAGTDSHFRRYRRRDGSGVSAAHDGYSPRSRRDPT